MSLTLDNIAKALIKWCSQESHQLKQYWAVEGGWESQASKEFIKFLKKHYKNHEVDNQKQVYISPDTADWIFNVNATEDSEKILAELACESFENKDYFENRVEQDMNKLSPENLKQEYKNAKRCMISIYFNSQFREQLHEKEFIEIFNNYEVGCAMKRL